jgi:integrase
MIAADPTLAVSLIAQSGCVLRAWNALTRAGIEISPNSSSMNGENKKQYKGFVPIGDGLYRKGNRIYLRVQRKIQGKGIVTWLSTKTNDVPKARKWKQKWEARHWMIENGCVPKEDSETAPALPEASTEEVGTDVAKSSGSPLPDHKVNSYIDQYEQAGQPIVKKRGIKAKAERTIRNEKYCLTPIRIFLGEKDARLLTMLDCDRYRDWRNSGGYVAKFKVRGHDVTRKTRGGDRAVDLELVALGNALRLGVRRGQLKKNPLEGRGQYTDESTVRHCRDVAPTPAGLVLIVDWLGTNGDPDDGDLAQFLSYSGLRVGEGLKLQWPAVDWDDDLIHVSRSKKGVFPFVLLLPELRRLMRKMKKKAKSKLLFQSPLDPQKSRSYSNFRRRLAQACKALDLPHVTPQGLRSYFVTQARQSGLTDAEIAQLIGDKTGPSLIAEVYGDVRPDHLLAVARKIQLTAKTRKLIQKVRKKTKSHI